MYGAGTAGLLVLAEAVFEGTIRAVEEVAGTDLVVVTFRVILGVATVLRAVEVESTLVRAEVAVDAGAALVVDVPADIELEAVLFEAGLSFDLVAFVIVEAAAPGRLEGPT